MHRLALHVRAELRTERFGGHEVDTTTEQVLQVELHAEIRLRRGRAIEPYEDVDIARLGGLVAGERAEQGETGHAESLSKRVPVLPKNLEDLTPAQTVHRSILWGGQAGALSVSCGGG